jgi:Gluconate 2-dehydrogenase subunit 3
MKRRNFVQSLLITPVAPAVVSAQTAPPAEPARQQPLPRANPQMRQPPQQPHEIPKLATTDADLTAQTAPQYFTTVEFATLRKLGEILMPPLKENPGAIEAGAPDFLDFLLGVSQEDRQKMYRSGLDGLERRSKQKFEKSFSDLSAEQADAILRPLLAARFWPNDPFKDPMMEFIAEVHEDLRTATVNSREWAMAAEKGGHRFSRGFRGSGYYWYPIDPISEG